MESRCAVGGLRLAFSQRCGLGTCEASETLIVPRPIRVTARRPEPSSSRENQKDVEAGIAELRKLLSGDGTSVGSSPPPTTAFGVSPPVRSGAANPLPQDRGWRTQHGMASARSLQTLHELDRSAHFLRSSASCAGDWRLLRISSPDGAGLPRVPSSCGGVSSMEDASSTFSTSVGSRGRRTPGPTPVARSAGSEIQLAY